MCIEFQVIKKIIENNRFEQNNISETEFTTRLIVMCRKADSDRWYELMNY